MMRVSLTDSVAINTRISKNCALSDGLPITIFATLFVWCATASVLHAEVDRTKLPECVHQRIGSSWDDPVNFESIIIGRTGERIYVHRENPQLCDPADTDACTTIGYLMPGDQLQAAYACGSWTWIQANDIRPAVKGLPYGWIETDRVKKTRVRPQPERTWAITNTDPLLKASWTGDIAELRRLVGNGYDVNKVVIESNAGAGPGHAVGVTALDVAVDANRLEVVNTLLQLGAHADLGHPGRHCGILSLSTDAAILEALIRAGARTDCDENHYPGGTALMDAAGEVGGSAVKVLIDAGVDLNKFDQDGRSALTVAADVNNVEGALLLLKAGADPNKIPTKKFDPIDSGSIPLFRAINEYRTTFDPTMTQLLLNYGADPNSRFTTEPCCPENEGGYTALTLVASAGFEPLARLLLEHGADPAMAQQNGERPADVALKSGHPKTVALINQFLRRENSGTRKSVNPNPVSQPQVP
jgi:ankyrin repeat protein